MRNGVPKPRPRMDQSKRRQFRSLTAVVTGSFHEFCIRATDAKGRYRPNPANPYVHGWPEGG